jgi:hypothetical protein
MLKTVQLYSPWIARSFTICMNISSGKNCWNVVGTFCGGKVQVTAAQKRGGCVNCSFYKDRERWVGNVSTAAHAISLDTAEGGFLGSAEGNG